MIRRQRSLSVRQAALLFAAYGLLMAVIAVGFWNVGAWMISPFVGLELGAITIAICLVCRRARDYELLVIEDDRVKIVRHEGRRESCFEFQRYWTRVSLTIDERAWYPSRLLIGSHGKMIEVGAYMNEAARRELARDLKEVMRA